jgi:chromosome segregation ATPase
MQRQEEIEKLIADLNRTRINNTAAINEYRRELGTLRDVLKSYVVQVDSLNQANIRLREENVQVRQQVVRFESELQQEREVKEDLSARVEMGSRLMVENLLASPLNQRGRENNRISRSRTDTGLFYSEAKCNCRGGNENSICQDHKT